MRTPELLETLVAAGRWPASPEAEREQLQRGLVDPSRVEAIAPGEETIHLLAPPFRTVAARLRGGEEFWATRMAAPEEIDPERTLVIADFGLGSDAPIVVDGRTAPPRVLRLSWPEGGRGETNTWVEVAPSFARFVEMLGV